MPPPLRFPTCVVLAKDWSPAPLPPLEPVRANPGFKLRCYAPDETVSSLWCEFQRLHSDGYTHVRDIPLPARQSYETVLRVSRAFGIVCFDRRRTVDHIARQCVGERTNTANRRSPDSRGAHAGGI